MMNINELNRIETELKIQLPSVYKDTMAHFPIPALVGNDDTMLWDDVEEIINLNLMLREPERFRDPWPCNLFALGQDGGGCSDAIDLSDPEYGVHWVDKQQIESIPNGYSDEKISQYIARYIRDMTHDLVSDGVEPNFTPQQRLDIETKNSKGCFADAIILVIGIFVIFWCVKYVLALLP